MNLFIIIYYYTIIISLQAINYATAKNIYFFFECPINHLSITIVCITKYIIGICVINSLSLSLIARTHYESIMHPQRVCTPSEVR